MILEWLPPKEFYKLPVTVEKKSWRFPYFCKSYCQRKIGTFLWATLYFNITKNLKIKGRPIVARPVYYTTEISEMLYIILESSLSLIPHILKYSLDFLERLDTTCTEDTSLSLCDIKSLHTKFFMIYFTKLLTIELKN